MGIPHEHNRKVEVLGKLPPCCDVIGLFDNCAGLFIKPRSRRLGGFLLCLRFIYFFLNRAAVGWAVSCTAFGLFYFFFSFVGEQTQTAGALGQLLSPDDVTISQLQAISKLFSSYPPSETFCQVSTLTIRTEHGRL